MTHDSICHLKTLCIIAKQQRLSLDGNAIAHHSALSGRPSGSLPFLYQILHAIVHFRAIHAHFEKFYNFAAILT